MAADWAQFSRWGSPQRLPAQRLVCGAAMGCCCCALACQPWSSQSPPVFPPSCSLARWFLPLCFPASCSPRQQTMSIAVIMDGATRTGLLRKRQLAAVLAKGELLHGCGALGSEPCVVHAHASHKSRTSQVQQQQLSTHTIRPKQRSLSFLALRSARTWMVLVARPHHLATGSLARYSLTAPPPFTAHHAAGSSTRSAGAGRGLPRPSSIVPAAQRRTVLLGGATSIVSLGSSSRMVAHASSSTASSEMEKVCGGGERRHQARHACALQPTQHAHRHVRIVTCRLILPLLDCRPPHAGAAGPAVAGEVAVQARVLHPVRILCVERETRWETCRACVSWGEGPDGVRRLKGTQPWAPLPGTTSRTTPCSTSQRAW